MTLMSAIHTVMSSVATQNATLSSDIQNATSGGKELEQEELLGIQFKLGQYNATLEAASSIAKSATDMLKTLAQRSN